MGRDGSIDWLCWPRFDSGACFAALLGDASNGRWTLHAIDPEASVTRRYRPDTLILETRFETSTGAVTVIDFMPPRQSASDLVRIVRPEWGRVPMRTELVLRFDYGAITPWVSRMADGALRAIAGPDMTLLRSTVPVHGEDLRTVGEFVVELGDTASFVCRTERPPRAAPGVDPHGVLVDTEAFCTSGWRTGTSRGTYAAAITRSLITLKALTTHHGGWWRLRRPRSGAARRRANGGTIDTAGSGTRRSRVVLMARRVLRRGPRLALRLVRLSP